MRINALLGLSLVFGCQAEEKALSSRNSVFLPVWCKNLMSPQVPTNLSQKYLGLQNRSVKMLYTYVPTCIIQAGKCRAPILIILPATELQLVGKATNSTHNTGCLSFQLVNILLDTTRYY